MADNMPLGRLHATSVVVGDDYPEYGSMEADARRFRWLLDGNGYFMEEECLCGHSPTSDSEKDAARAKIDAAMRGE